MELTASDKRKDTKAYNIATKQTNQRKYILFKAIFDITVHKQQIQKEIIMPNNEPTPNKESNAYEVITYTDVVGFNYTLPDEEEQQTLEHELTFVWEDTLEKFVEEHGADKSYTIQTFKREREQKFFIDQIERLTDDLIDEVQEEIANKMKFGFEFTGQLHNDD